MNNFYEGLAFDAAERIEATSRSMYQLREQRSALLRSYGVEEEQDLLDAIERGELDESSAREHYDAAVALREQRDALRSELQAFLGRLAG